MNVVQRENWLSFKTQPLSKKQLVQKDVTLGIRGSSALFPKSFNSKINKKGPTYNTGPRYQFGNKKPSNSKRLPMGPPLVPPPSSKRRSIYLNSSSTKLDSSSSCNNNRPHVLASDSARNTSQGFSTPINRPSALRYISSSSRGGRSRTRSSRSSTSNSVAETSVILAISEGRGMARGEIGMAAIDLRQPHLVLCQFSDTLLYTHTMTKINYFNPIEIIVPHTFCEGAKPNQLYQLIKDQYPLMNITTVQRRHFNDAAGRQQIQSLCAPHYSAVYLQVMQKFYALTAAAAVLKYVEYIQCIVFARESLKIHYHSSENTMIIDVGTATQLELVQPLIPSAGHTCCLLGVLGPTYTVGGIRALRAAILQPSSDREFIENRLDAVQDLNENDHGLISLLQDVLKRLSEIDKILFLCVDNPNHNKDRLGEAQLNQILLLKTTMDMVPKLVEALEAAESGRLKKIKLDLENPHYTEIASRIRNIIQEDAHLEKGAVGCMQRCFAVKPNINGLLDVARRTYSELVDDIQKMVEQLGETYDLKLRLNQNMFIGFHIVLSIAPKNRGHFNVEDLPDIFIQVQNHGSSITMTTEELVVMDQQTKESLKEIQKLSNIIISGLLKELRPFMSSLYVLCDDVAELDILLALAQASSIGSYIRPEFDSYTDIRSSVHPLLDYNSQTMPIPNDIYASPEKNFTIITGPNMGGKTIYIKQIAVMQIMAQLGCFLPATKAVLRLSDRIFSRLGFNDSVEMNASTYSIEMQEVQHLLKGLTKTSLVIMDELCRGTSEYEGTAMAWAICEELLMSDAFCFLTTHFISLTRLQDLYFNVTNLHTLVTEEDPGPDETYKRLVYKYKIEPGVTAIEHYGLALARMTNMPEETVNLAEELAQFIVKNTKSLDITTPEISDEKELYELNAALRKAHRWNQGEEARQLYSKFKEEHAELIERLRAERNNKTDSIEKTSETSKQLDIANGAADNSDTYAHQINSKAIVIYSTHSDLQQEDYNNNNTTVKSSNELLHTIMTSRNHISIEEISGTDGQDDLQYEMSFSYKQNTFNKNPHFLNKDCHQQINKTISNKCRNVDDINKNSSSLNTFSQIEHKTVQHEQRQSTQNDYNQIPMCENSNILSDDMISDTDSDIAEALTQEVKEISDIIPKLPHQNKDDENSEDESFDGSMDDELMNETIQEIYEELNSDAPSLDSIILTPPLGFQ